MKNHLKNMVLSLLVILLVFAGNVAYVNALEPVDCDPGEITEEPTPLFSVRPAESTPVNDAYTIPRKMAKLSHIISTDEVYNAIMSLQSEYPEGKILRLYAWLQGDAYKRRRRANLYREGWVPVPGQRFQPLGEGCV